MEQEILEQQILVAEGVCVVLVMLRRKLIAQQEDRGAGVKYR